MARQRFTVDGGDALERELQDICDRVAAEVRREIPGRNLEGLLLGGGYGRGEGGVLRSAGGERPYNDLEFYLLARGHALWAERAFGPRLRALGHRLSEECGIEVEFKVTTRSKLAHEPTTMFNYDLVAGHKWLVGSEELLVDSRHHLEPSRIPLAEATRLLMNRCSGLLFSAERLARDDFGPADADFVGRNLAKAELALGDVILTTFGRYHWSCLERHRRLKALSVNPEPPRLKDVQAVHSKGVEFKLHPVQSRETRVELAARHGSLRELARVLWVWLESRRLHVTFYSPEQYALSGCDKCPETWWLKNGLVNLRTFGLSGLSERRRWRYPRERLLEALALLLFVPDRLDEPTIRNALQGALGTTASGFVNLVERYRQLWVRFN